MNSTLQHWLLYVNIFAINCQYVKFWSSKLGLNIRIRLCNVGFYMYVAQSIALTRGPSEVVQHLRLQYKGRSHRRKSAAYLTLNLIWFGCIARLSQWGGGG
jgi:hypothetical protein